MNQKSPNHVLIEGKIIDQKEVAALLKAIKPYKEESIRGRTKIHYVVAVAKLFKIRPCILV